MKTPSVRLKRILVHGCLLLGVVSGLALGCRENGLDLKDVPRLLSKKLEILSRMRIDLLKSVEAEKSAVMADTDEASQAFAQQAQKATGLVEQGRREVRGLMEQDHSAEEWKLLQEFDDAWSEFLKTDRVILAFAVQNTNLKAARLSFGPGGEAMNRLEAALTRLTSNPTGIREGPAQHGKICRILTAGWKVLYLQAPHIAAAEDNRMNEIEAAIRRLQDEMVASFAALKSRLPQERQSDLREAEAAFKELQTVTAQVIGLSRQNTNIKSFELSLGRKRKISARCDEVLAALQEAVRSREFKATR
jgi:hypothetical protein